MRDGERQVAPDLNGIRRDHVARYEWVRSQLERPSRIVDVACGIGYGAKILATAQHRVFAIDNDAEALAYGQAHYDDPLIAWRCEDAQQLGRLDVADVATCFETIEHLEHPALLLRDLARAAPVLFASVPNEEVFPWRNYKFHYRHYTRSQFAALLETAGYEVTGWWGQAGPHSEVEANVNGRTLIVTAKRKSGSVTKRPARKIAADKATTTVTIEPNFKIDTYYEDPKLLAKFLAPPVDLPFLPPPDRPVPERVAILGIGPSLTSFVNYLKRAGGRKPLCDEIWGINAVGDVIRCDRVFHMDDVRIQQIRADVKRPNCNIAPMLEWLKTHPGPVYTSRPHPDYPGMVAFPLAEVLNSLGGERYFNSTAAYAVAYAIHIGVKKIMPFGFDFSYANSHKAEQGRACVEFWLGYARARGIEILIPQKSPLMDACVENKHRLYGYDTVRVEISGATGAESVTFTPRDDLPTADEIEDRYDHTAHPNHLVREQANASP